MSTQVMPIGFLALNEGDDPKSLPPGTMLRNDNCAMDKGRRLIKRDGVDGVVKTTLDAVGISSGARLTPRASRLAMTDGQVAYSYVDQLASWQSVDRPPNLSITSRVLADSTRSINQVDIAISGTMLITLYAVTGSNGLYVAVADRDTGGTILAPTQVASASAHYPRIAISGTVAFLFFTVGSGIAFRTLNLSTLALSAAANLVTDGVATATVFDAVIATPTGLNVPTLYVVYELATGTNRTRIASFAVSAIALPGPTTPSHTLDSLGTGLICCCIAFGAASQRIVMSYSVASHSKMVSCDPSVGTSVGPTEFYADTSDIVFCAEDSATNFLIGWNRNDGSGTSADRLSTELRSVAANAQVATSQRVTFGLYNPTKPWRVAGRWYAAAITWVHPYSVTAADAIAQPSSVIVEIETVASLTGAQGSTHPHVGTLENQTGWYAPGLGLCAPVVDGDGTAWVATPRRSQEPQNYPAQIGVSWVLYRIAMSGHDLFRSAPLGANALCAGGAPYWDDGASTMPLGFAHAPQIISITAGAGGSVAVGDYSYVATYAWRDANGVLHRSAPSAPKIGTSASSNNTLAVKVATSSLSAKQRALTASNSANPVFIELWRTAVGATGPHYQRTGGIEPAATTQIFLNDPRAGDVTFSDTRADANVSNTTPAIALTTLEQLYTDTGELENESPPSLITDLTHGNRIVGIGPDLRTVWPSKLTNIDATIAPGFNEALTIAFTRNKTALASLDATLVVFGEDEIHLVYGDGPDDTGAGSWDVKRMQTDVGCIEPRSVVTTPDGVMFLSRGGIQLLDRGLNVSWIGKGVLETLATYPNVTSAVLVSEVNEVRFTIDDGTHGLVLVYDYFYKTWFRRFYTDASDTAVANIRFVDAALINGVYTLLTAGGQVYRETAAHRRDGSVTGAYVSRDILLSPFTPSPSKSGWSNGPLGWVRIKDCTLMGTSITPHDLELSFALDYSASFTDSKTFLAGTDVTTPGPLEKCRRTLTTQKCQAVQIRIRDLTPTTGSIGTGDGPIIEALALRVGVMDGPAKVGIGQEA